MQERLKGFAQRLIGPLSRRQPLGRQSDRAGPAPEPRFDFDELAKGLAQGLSRREALRRLGTGLGAAALASLGVVAPALAACPKGQTSCSGVCVNPSTDPKNCGKCGNTCPATATCQKGTCVCPTTAPKLCNGVCVNTQTDARNCGKCG